MKSMDPTTWVDVALRWVEAWTREMLTVGDRDENSVDLIHAVAVLPREEHDDRHETVVAHLGALKEVRRWRDAHDGAKGAAAKRASLDALAEARAVELDARQDLVSAIVRHETGETGETAETGQVAIAAE